MAVRRGDMAQALEVLRALTQAFPDDAALAKRAADLSEALQPAELFNPKARTSDPATAASARPASPEQEGERLFALGDFPGAIGAYRRALADRPDSELIRDRLEELFRLAQAGSQRPSAPAPAPPGPTTPADPEATLAALLDRIATRRRA